MSESMEAIGPGINRATTINAAVMGAVFGLSGFGHGFFEMLQGRAPTGGLMINAIGDKYLFWAQGHEPAFTLIPDFLITGIAAMAVGVAAIIWSAGFLHRRRGPLIFMLLFLLLLLIGGGVAQVIFFPVFWLLAARIQKPPSRWRTVLPSGVRRAMGGLWPPLLALSALCILYTLQIAVFGYVPGVSDPDTISIIMVSILGAGYLLLILACIAGFARDTGKEECNG